MEIHEQQEWLYRASPAREDREQTTAIVRDFGFICRNPFTDATKKQWIPNVQKVLFRHVIHLYYVDKEGGTAIGSYQVVGPNNHPRREQFAAAVEGAIQSKQTYNLEISMVPNPSHLEHVNPVTMGMARAAATQANHPGPAYFDKAISLPIIIHGDAAFPGQGVVAETLNLYGLRGYRCGGTIHIIANNQLGFTTNAWASRSTPYASDLAKGFRMPIVHVNADDPEACIEVARVAAAYRFKFQKDFVIDLIGYRRYGHNEGDEPRFTQPRMYHIIDNHPTVRNLLAQRLINEGKTSGNFVSSRFEAHTKLFQSTLEKLQGVADLPRVELKPAPPGAAKKTITTYSADGLRELNQALLQLPEGFALNTRLQRIRIRMETALDTLEERAIDWGHAEMLAYDSMVTRYTG